MYRRPLGENLAQPPDWCPKQIVESSEEERATIHLTKDELETVVNALSTYHDHAVKDGIAAMVDALALSLIGTHDWKFGPVPPSKWMMAQIDQMELSADIDAEADEETFEKAADTADQMDKLNETLPNDALPVGLIDANQPNEPAAICGGIDPAAPGIRA